MSVIDNDDPPPNGAVPYKHGQLSESELALKAVTDAGINAEPGSVEATAREFLNREIALWSNARIYTWDASVVYTGEKLAEHNAKQLRDLRAQIKAVLNHLDAVAGYKRCSLCDEVYEGADAEHACDEG